MPAARHADTGNVGWLMSGHLCPEDIPAGRVEFPGAIGDFLFGAEPDGDFPIDPVAARATNHLNGYAFTTRNPSA